MRGMKAYLAVIGAWVLAAVGGLAAETFALRQLPGGKLFGPYVLAEGVGIGGPTQPYVLTGVTNAVFCLRAREGGGLLGPFACTNGAYVTVKGVLFSVVKPPPLISGTVTHPALKTILNVQIMPVTPEFMQELYQLRYLYATLDARHAVQTAPIRTAPVVTGMPGYRRDGIATRSAHDQARSADSRDRQARPAFDKFVGKFARFTVRSDSAGRFLLPPLPPGNYVLFAEGRSVSPGPGALSLTYAWWSTVQVTESGGNAIELNADNAMTWDALFDAVKAGPQGLGMRLGP